MVFVKKNAVQGLLKSALQPRLFFQIICFDDPAEKQKDDAQNAASQKDQCNCQKNKFLLRNVLPESLCHCSFKRRFTRIASSAGLKGLVIKSFAPISKAVRTVPSRPSADKIKMGVCLFNCFLTKLM